MKNPHGSGNIIDALHLRSFPVVEKHTLIWVWMGDQPRGLGQDSGLQLPG